MIKHRFLIAVAATALTVGSGVALAQSPGAGSGKAQSPAAGQSGAGSMDEHKGAAGERKGAASENKASAPKQNTAQDNKGDNKALPGKDRMGQSAQPKSGSKSESKSETTGQAPKDAQPGGALKSEPSGKGKGDQLNKSEHLNKSEQKGAQDKDHMNKNGASSQSGKPSTTGQGGPNQGGTMRNESQSQGGSMRNNERGEGGNREGGMNRSGTGTTTNSSTTTNTTVNLSTEQRTRIKAVIVKEHNAPRVTTVDFSLSVGTRVPRGKVHFVAVPRTIIDIQPAWRGYEYFLVGDQIVIVNPNTLEIVAVIEA